MAKLAGIPHPKAIRTFEKAGFRRRMAGLTIEEFKELLLGAYTPNNIRATLSGFIDSIKQVFCPSRPSTRTDPYCSLTL